MIVTISSTLTLRAKMMTGNCSENSHQRKQARIRDSYSETSSGRLLGVRNKKEPTGNSTASQRSSHRNAMFKDFHLRGNVLAPVLGDLVTLLSSKREACRLLVLHL